MASPAIGMKTCTLKVNLFTGARTALPDGTKALLTIRDGNQRTLRLPKNGFVTTSGIAIEDLPFFDNFGDNYAVIASADGYQQAGFHPVVTNPAHPAVADLMLLKKDASYNFKRATWSRLKQNYPSYAALLKAGAASDTAAGNRYSDLMEHEPETLACCFNLLTAMSQIQLPVKTPFDYIRELIWDQTMQRDRFFAWADAALIDQVMQATAHDAFSPEPGTAIFHAGATRSWKQIQFGEANVQLTFHENDKKTIDGAECVMLEPDIDYFRDPLAHALLEVTPNGLTHTITDPRQVYVLRWMAGRHAGVPNFEPPYTLE
jgi:hypothetical protein